MINLPYNNSMNSFPNFLSRIKSFSFMKKISILTFAFVACIAIGAFAQPSHDVNPSGLIMTTKTPYLGNVHDPIKPEVINHLSAMATPVLGEVLTPPIGKTRTLYYSFGTPVNDRVPTAAIITDVTLSKMYGALDVSTLKPRDYVGVTLPLDGHEYQIRFSFRDLDDNIVKVYPNENGLGDDGKPMPLLVATLVPKEGKVLHKAYDYRTKDEYLKTKKKEGFAYISGYVVDDNEMPLSGAKITLRKSQKDTHIKGEIIIELFTDKDGWYEYYLPKSDDGQELFYMNTASLSGYEIFDDEFRNNDGFLSSAYFNTYEYFVYKLRKINQVENLNVLKIRTLLNASDFSRIQIETRGILGCGDVPTNIRIGWGTCTFGSGSLSCTSQSTVLFKSYCRYVLKNEWAETNWGSFEGMYDAAAVGAIAIKSYAWWFINNYATSSSNVRLVNICTTTQCQALDGTDRGLLVDDAPFTSTLVYSRALDFAWKYVFKTPGGSIV